MRASQSPSAMLRLTGVILLLSSIVASVVPPDELDFLVRVFPKQSHAGRVESPPYLRLQVDNQNNPAYKQKYIMEQRVQLLVTHPNGTKWANVTKLARAPGAMACKSTLFSNVFDEGLEDVPGS
jgi:hypothetical protein